LASAREHPPAVVLRQQQRDAELVTQFIRELSDRQSQLFLLLSAFILDYQPPEWQPIVDDDVAEAAAALASTFETASRGVIYEHRPASLPAERLMAALKPLIVEAGKNGGTAFERDAAVVLRRIEEAARAARKDDPGNRRAMIERIGRVLEKPEDGGVPVRDERPRLILP